MNLIAGKFIALCLLLALASVVLWAEELRKLLTRSLLKRSQANLALPR